MKSQYELGIFDYKINNNKKYIMELEEELSISKMYIKYIFGFIALAILPIPICYIAGTSNIFNFVFGMLWVVCIAILSYYTFNIYIPNKISIRKYLKEIEQLEIEKAINFIENNSERKKDG